MKNNFPKVFKVSSVLFGLLFFINLAYSSHQSGNVLGWIWSGSTNDSEFCLSPEDCGNTGWTSISSGNDYPEHDPNGPSYGIDFPDSDGPVTGSVWVANVGWIDFQPASPFPDTDCSPSCPTTGVERVGDLLEGWARITAFQDAEVSGNSGGFQGWIKMSGFADNGLAYGVSIDDATGAVTGLAWSDELGWLDFDASIPIAPPPPPPPTGFQVICSGSPNPAYLSTGGKVNWTAFVISGGSGPYLYSWSFNPAPFDIIDTIGGDDFIATVYDVTGIKSATITVTDNVGATTDDTCSVTVLKQGRVEEIIPLPL